MGELSEIAKKRSPYLSLEAGESLVATYKGFKMVPSTYDPEKENYRFLLGVTIGDETTTKFWDTGSNKVALVFDELVIGDKVKITKTVSTSKNGKEQTSWDVEHVVDTEGKVTKKQAAAIDQEMAG